MTNKIAKELQEALVEVLDAPVSEHGMKGIKKAVDEIINDLEGDIMYRMKDDLAHNLAAWCVDMAGHAVEAMLEGNEDQLRRYLSCEKRGEDGQYIGWTGRSDGNYFGKREDREWHSVIHGRLFEQGAVALRKKIVDAHPEVLKSERILDLEDQVKSLVAQINHKEAECERFRQRLREANAY
jgi:hypothetical protein